VTKLPAANAGDDEWHPFAVQSCEAFIPYLERFLLDRFAYKPRYVQQHLWRSFSTISARTAKYDLYGRMFKKPYGFPSRDCVVLARIGFQDQRVGHGRALVELVVKLAPKFGYRFVAIESVNLKAAAFAERLGFMPYLGGDHWVGEIEAISRALGQSAALACKQR
jgi:hypothetical protein